MLRLASLVLALAALAGWQIDSVPLTSVIVGSVALQPTTAIALIALLVGLAGAYASEWSLLSMYLLLVAVVSVRARGLWGKKSVLEA